MREDEAEGIQLLPQELFIGDDKNQPPTTSRNNISMSIIKPTIDRLKTWLSTFLGIACQISESKKLLGAIYV